MYKFEDASYVSVIFYCGGTKLVAKEETFGCDGNFTDIWGKQE